MILRSHTYTAIPPGETIKEQLEIYGMSIKEFTQKTGFSEKYAEELINGSIPISSEIAQKLESTLGTPANVWLNLEKIYEETAIKVNAENLSDIKISI